MKEEQVPSVVAPIWLFTAAMADGPTTAAGAGGAPLGFTGGAATVAAQLVGVLPDCAPPYAALDAPTDAPPYETLRRKGRH